MNGPSDVAYPCIKLLKDERKRARKAPYHFYYVRRSAARFFRFPVWPRRDWHLPGAIFDADGRLFTIEGLHDWRPAPVWIAGLDFLGLGGILFRLLHREFRLTLSPPREFTVDEARTLIGLVVYGGVPDSLKGEDRQVFDRTTGRLQACRSHREIIDFVEWFQNTDGGRPDAS